MSASVDDDLARLAARTPSRRADAVAAALDPSVVTVVVLAIVALASTRPVAAAGWWSLAVLFLAVVPLLELVVFLRLGWVSDRHVVRRTERHRLHLAAVVSMAVGAFTLWRAGAPGPLVRLVVADLVGFLALAAITLWSKISAHTATVAGAAVALAMLWTPASLTASAPLTVAVGWARWRAGRHSLAQIVAGAGLGIGCTAVVLLLTRSAH